MTKGRHNFKFGFFIERNSKTEPGSVGYAGQYNFGHSDDDPISGNGYANALLGRFTSYSELNNRSTGRTGTGRPTGTRRTAGASTRA